MTDNQIKDRLVWARSRRGMSQLQLAEAAQIAAAQISRYESGRATPRPQLVAKLAETLNVGFEWLLSGQGAPAADLPAYQGTPFRGGGVQIEIPSELYMQLKRSADSNGRSLEAETAIRLKRSLSTDPARSVAGMQQVQDHVRVLQRLIEELEGTPEGVPDLSPDPVEQPTRQSKKITKVIVENREVKALSNRGKDAGELRTIPVEIRKKRTFVKRGVLPKPPSEPDES